MTPSAIVSIYEITTEIVTFTAVARCCGLILALVRMFRLQRGALTTKWGWIEICTLPEILIFYIATYVFVTRDVVPSELSVASLVAPIIGALLALSGFIITSWAFFCFPKVSAGHYVEKEHRLITAGPYGFVRHPIYIGVFLIWFSLAIAFLNLWMFLITVLYVVPMTILYMRSEEAMMLNELGDEYIDYCERVGMVFPRFR